MAMAIAAPAAARSAAAARVRARGGGGGGGARRRAAARAAGGGGAAGAGEGEGEGKGKAAVKGESEEKGGGEAGGAALDAAALDSSAPLDQSQPARAAAAAEAAAAVPPDVDPVAFNSAEAVAARTRVLELTRSGPERVEVEQLPGWFYPKFLDRLPALFGRMSAFNGPIIYFTGALWAETQGAEFDSVRAQWLVWMALGFYVVYRVRLWLWRRNRRKELQGEVAAAAADSDAAAEGVDGSSADPEAEIAALRTRQAKYEWRRSKRDAWLDMCLSQQMLLPAGMAGQVTMLWVLPAVWLARWIAHADPPFQWLRLARGAATNALMLVCAPVALASMLYAGVASLAQLVQLVPTDPTKALMLTPMSLLVSYTVNLAPSGLLYKAIVAQWRRMRNWQRWSRQLKEAKEEAAIAAGAPQPTKAHPMEKFVWIALFVGAIAFSMSFPKRWFSDLPITGIFILQWWNSARRSAGGEGVFDAAIDVMINKGVSKEAKEAAKEVKDRQAAVEGTAPPPPAAA